MDFYGLKRELIGDQGSHKFFITELVANCYLYAKRYKFSLLDHYLEDSIYNFAIFMQTTY